MTAEASEKITSSPLNFLSGGGETGALIRSQDWSVTSLGSPDKWPSLLKTSIRLLLTSKHPMIIWWGPSFLQFYNDGYLKTLGTKLPAHPPGQSARQCWSDEWSSIESYVSTAMLEKEAVLHEEGFPEVTNNVWQRYSYSPIEDVDGIQGILIICNDATQSLKDEEKLPPLNWQRKDEIQGYDQTEAASPLGQECINTALKKTKDALVQQIDDWQRLHQMNSGLLQARTLEEQFEVALKTIVDLHQCSQGVIALFDSKKGKLVTQVSVGISDAGLAQLAFAPEQESAEGLAFQKKQRVVIADTKAGSLGGTSLEFARKEGVRALCCTPLFNMAGTPLGVMSVYFAQPKIPDEREFRLTDICTDQIARIVERDRSEKQLHQELERSHQILATMNDGFLLMDSEFRVLQINVAGLKIDGRKASEIIGKSHWELWPDTYESTVGKAFRQAMTERKSVTFQHCYSLFGRETWFDVRAYPHKEGLAVLYRDITSLKQAGNELARVIDESERRHRLYQTVLTNTPDLAYVFDLEHRFIYANEVLLRMWGKSWDEAIGKTCLELGYEPWHAAMHDREIEQVKLTKKPLRGEVPFHGTFGRRIYEYIFTPVIGPDGKVEAIAGTTRDVTERKNEEELLRKDSLRKDDFLAMLAHELRNPLAPISAAAELMEMVKLDEKRLKNTSQLIIRQVRHMSSLLDDLLDVSRVTRGLVTIGKTPQNLNDIVSSTLEQVRPLIESRGHHLALDLPPEAPYVLGDQKRLVQILTNLLNNAAKYTAEGGNIHLKIEAHEESLTLLVQDDGIGISAELQPRIFELFTQAERTSDRSQGGLGIGLAVVKSLTELHGGTVSCISKGNGTGSLFVLTFPRLAESGVGTNRRRYANRFPMAEKKLRILVVDDNADAAEMLAMCLEASGHEVMVEHGSKKALERARREIPDACILDIGLPEMDGYELAQKLRKQRETEKVLLIAVTGYGQDQDKQKAFAAGFEHHLIKPVDTARLAELLAQKELA